jgi:hypothetical protein
LNLSQDCRQRTLVIDGFGQEVNAVARTSTPQRLDGTPDAHALRGGTDGDAENERKETRRRLHATGDIVEGKRDPDPFFARVRDRTTFAGQSDKVTFDVNQATELWLL